MNKVLLLLVLGVFAGVYFLGGTRLEEKHIEDLYAASHKAFMEMDAKASCAMMAKEFEQKLTVSMDSHKEDMVMDKAMLCDSESEDFGDRWNLGSRKQKLSSRVKYRYTITGITLAPDRRSALVEVRGTLEMPGVYMTWRSKDTVVRRRWKTLVTQSNGRMWVGSAYH